MKLPAGAAVGVIGAGTMGAGIAQVAALAGHPVLLFDVSPGRAAIAVTGVSEELDRLVRKGRITQTSAAAARANFTAANGIAELAACGLVIEAAVESLEVKRSIFAELETVVGDTCVLASNTSSLSITAVAANLRRPHRFLGMHFFNPAPVMRLVEVVSGLATDPGVAAAIAATAAAWGKTAVLVASAPGFVVNRVARPFYGESLRALEEQAADPATIDAIFREAGGFRMGPLELTDLIGQDVNLAVSRSVWNAFGQDPRYQPSQAQQSLVDANRLGRKTGRGFYSYDGGQQVPGPMTAPTCAAPHGVVRSGNWGPWEALWQRARSAGVEFAVELAGPAAAQLPSGTMLVPTDGRTATERAAISGHPTVIVDLALDAATASRFAIAASDGCPPTDVISFTGLLQATGAAVSVIDDLAGLLVGRTVAMLVNEATDVVGRGVASASDVDLAMLLGVGYPRGPLAWGDAIGPARVVEMLDALARTYGDGRYRACPSLRRVAHSGQRLSEYTHPVNNRPATGHGHMTPAHLAPAQMTTEMTTAQMTAQMTTAPMTTSS